MGCSTLFGRARVRALTCSSEIREGGERTATRSEILAWWISVSACCCRRPSTRRANSSICSLTPSTASCMLPTGNAAAGTAATVRLGFGSLRDACREEPAFGMSKSSCFESNASACRSATSLDLCSMMAHRSWLSACILSAFSRACKRFGPSVPKFWCQAAINKLAYVPVVAAPTSCEQGPRLSRCELARPSRK